MKVNNLDGKEFDFEPKGIGREFTQDGYKQYLKEEFGIVHTPSDPDQLKVLQEIEGRGERGRFCGNCGNCGISEWGP